MVHGHQRQVEIFFLLIMPITIRLSSAYMFPNFLKSFFFAVTPFHTYVLQQVKPSDTPCTSLKSIKCVESCWAKNEQMSSKLWAHSSVLFKGSQCTIQQIAHTVLHSQIDNNKMVKANCLYDRIEPFSALFLALGIVLTAKGDPARQPGIPKPCYWYSTVQCTAGVSQVQFE